MTDLSKEQSVKAQLRQWIAAKHGQVSADAIADDTPIITQKLITSVQVLDLILFVESLGANGLEPSQLTPASFQSVGSIYQTFFA